jgi:ABC-type branched-subunit amino acid transport system ATPase component
MQMNEPEAHFRPARKTGPVILDLKNISLSFGGVKALTDISFDVREHEIRAIIGPNGAGKSSMLNVINGVYRPQQGRSSIAASTARIWTATRPPNPASPAPSRTSRCSRA